MLTRHASLLSSFLLENSLNFGVNEITSFQKLASNVDKMRVANLGRQHDRSLDSYFKSSWGIILYLLGAINYVFVPSILLKLVAYILKLI